MGEYGWDRTSLWRARRAPRSSSAFISVEGCARHTSAAYMFCTWRRLWTVGRGDGKNIGAKRGGRDGRHMTQGAFSCSARSMRREDGGQLSPEMSPAMQGGLSGDHRRGEKSCRGGGSLDAPAGRCLLWGRGGRTGVRLGALYGCSTCSRARRRQKREDAGIQGRLTDCEYSGGRRKRRDGRCRGHCTRRRIRISSLMGTARSRAGRICIREHGGEGGCGRCVGRSGIWRASAASAICNRAHQPPRAGHTPRARSATTAKFIMGRRALMCQC